MKSMKMNNMIKMSMLALTAFSLMAVIGCTSPDRALVALQNEGYTDIELTGYTIILGT